MMTRLEKILSCIDVTCQVGLEVGALMNPVVTREMGKIRYIDHASTEELRAKYAHDANVDTKKIVDVDYVWGKQSLPELLEQDAPFDYLVASHVIEHVPDFIGWLEEVRAVLKVGSILSLVIPDKRYCFDHHRPLTEASDVIGAFLSHSRKPSPQQVFENFSSAVYYDGQITWDKSVVIAPEKFSPIHSHLEAWNLASHSLLEGQYVDTHCWVFTPESFFNLLKTLIGIGLFGFSVERFYETEGCEFYVSLKALDLSTISESDRKTLQLASLPVDVFNTNLFSEQSMEPEKEEESHTIKIQRLSQELTTAQKQLEDLQNSKSWKLVASLRRLKQYMLKPLHKN